MINTDIDSINKITLNELRSEIKQLFLSDKYLSPLSVTYHSTDEPSNQYVAIAVIAGDLSCTYSDIRNDDYIYNCYSSSTKFITDYSSQLTFRKILELFSDIDEPKLEYKINAYIGTHIIESFNSSNNYYCQQYLSQKVNNFAQVLKFAVINVAQFNKYPLDFAVTGAIEKFIWLLADEITTVHFDNMTAYYSQILTVIFKQPHVYLNVVAMVNNHMNIKLPIKYLPLIRDFADLRFQITSTDDLDLLFNNLVNRSLTDLQQRIASSHITVDINGYQDLINHWLNEIKQHKYNDYYQKINDILTIILKLV